jgi:hypothetical protein
MLEEVVVVELTPIMHASQPDINPGAKKRVRFTLTEPVPEAKSRHIKKPVLTKRRDDKIFYNAMLNETVRGFTDRERCEIADAVRKSLVSESSPIKLSVYCDPEDGDLPTLIETVFYWPDSLESGGTLIYRIKLLHRTVMNWNDSVFKQAHVDMIRACREWDTDYSRRMFASQLGCEKVGRFSLEAPENCNIDALYNCVCVEY